MTALYFDASALVKYYVREPGSTWVRALIMEQANIAFITLLTIVEVSAAISICERTGKLTHRQRWQAYDALKEDVRRGFFRPLNISAAIVGEAADLTQRHSLKGYDAVQVASALVLSQALEVLQTEPLIFVSGDTQALTAAEAEGLAVDDPFRHVKSNEGSQ